MSSPALSLCEAVCIPSIQVPINIMTLVSYILPPVLGYCVVAVLAVTPQTHTLRIALWPVIMSLALRAAFSVDLSLGEPDRKFYNTVFVFSMVFIVTRTFDWTLAKEPLARHLRPTKGSRSTIMDALDLASTLRGYGWDWSGKVHIPRETRPTSRGGFTFYLILSAAVHALGSGLLQRAIVSFFPMRHEALSGRSIFDETLPFHVRYLRASVISVFAVFWIYAFIQLCYDTCTIIAVLIFGQEPAQWPPAFDAPWCSISQSEFWGRRWHQFFRRMFLVQGGYPLSFFLGRVGLVIGTFLSSAVMHHFAMVTFDDQIELWRMLVGFGMMAPAVLAEGVFKRLTGRKVGGRAGWVWTMAWLLVWGNVMIDGFARAGAFEYVNFTQGLPGQAVVEHLVVNFDSWLHTI